MQRKAMMGAVDIETYQGLLSLGADEAQAQKIAEWMFRQTADIKAEVHRVGQTMLARFAQTDLTIAAAEVRMREQRAASEIRMSEKIADTETRMMERSAASELRLTEKITAIDNRLARLESSFRAMMIWMTAITAAVAGQAVQFYFQWHI